MLAARILYVGGWLAMRLDLTASAASYNMRSVSNIDGAKRGNRHVPSEWPVHAKNMLRSLSASNHNHRITGRIAIWSCKKPSIGELSDKSWCLLHEQRQRLLDSSSRGPRPADYITAGRRFPY